MKPFYVCGPYAVENLGGAVHHFPQRPSLEKPAMMRRDLLPRRRYMMDSIFTTGGCPNHCSFCPVTDTFGAGFDSVFGHPQIIDWPEENQYYLDLYRELARLRPRRLWAGAGGLSAVNYRRILELAAESGLCSIAAGLESISAQGQKQSGPGGSCTTHRRIALTYGR